jgi:hypothetical protein
MTSDARMRRAANLGPHPESAQAGSAGRVKRVKSVLQVRNPAVGWDRDSQSSWHNTKREQKTGK